MTMIVLRLLSLLGLKSQWHRHFSPRRLNNKVFFRGGISVDSWTLGPKPLCHRHPTGPHPSGLLWTPWTPAKGDSTKSNFALKRRQAGRRFAPVGRLFVGIGQPQELVLAPGAAGEGEAERIVRRVLVAHARDHAGRHLHTGITRL